MVEEKYYAVKRGRKPGIYKTFQECRVQTTGFYRPIFRVFKSLEQAQEFMKDNKKRFHAEIEQESSDDDTTFDIKKTKFTWSKSGTEMARDLIADNVIIKEEEPETETSLTKESLTKESEKKVPDINVTTSQLAVTNRMNCWVDTDIDGFIPLMCIYFGENDERNFVGVCDWKPPKEKTRVGLATVVRAISRTLQYISKHKLKSEHSSLIIHSENRYLCNAIIQFLKNWPNIPNDKNEDIYKFLQKQLKSTSLRIHCVRENVPTKKELVSLKSMLENYKNK
jgi:hypothetical protein